MRALLYTATIFFVGIIGLFAFFALQPPLNDNGAKVVLSIDTSAMPKVEASNSAPSGGATAADSYGKGDERLGNSGEQPQQVSASTSAPLTSPQPAASGAKQEALPLAGTMLSVDTPDEVIDAQASHTPLTAGGKPQQNPANARLANTPNAASSTGATVSPSAKAKDAAAKDASAATSARAPVSSAKPEDTLAANLAALDAPHDDPHPANAPAAPSAPAQAPAPGGSAIAPSAPPVVAVAPVPALPPIPARRPAQTAATVKTAALDAASGQANSAAATVPVTTTEATPKQVRVAILIRGVGGDSHDSREAVEKLPSAISLGFVPSNDDAKEWATKARDRGHEVIVQLPLEPSSASGNVSAETLLSTAEPLQNVARLNTVLERFDGPSGVTNMMGGKLLQSKEALRPILQDIKNRGLIYIAEGNNNHTLVRQMARELNLRYGSASVIIDTQPTPDGVKKALERLVAAAQKNGSAIGIGSANGVTIEELQTWSQELATRGITLVPVGALAQTPGAS